ncbi:hypothetical protein V8C86DRAFT_2810805 [Haematococcus lacustris]
MQWLQGSCTNPSCKLQHKVCHDLMPACTFFAKGLCTAQDCPWLHVRYAKGTPVCRAFLSGYCPNGGRCSRAHILSKTAMHGSRPRKQ